MLSFHHSGGIGTDSVVRVTYLLGSLGALPGDFVCFLASARLSKIWILSALSLAKKVDGMVV